VHMIERLRSWWSQSLELGRCICSVLNVAQWSWIMRYLSINASKKSDKLTDRQTHWVEKLMPYANIMRILYRKGSLNEADPVSRRPDFHPIDDEKLYNTQESLWWDGKVLDVMRSDNEPALLALSTEELNVNVDFFTRLK